MERKSWCLKNVVEFEFDGYLLAEELLKALEYSPCEYQIYILDICIGKGNGFEIAKEIRKKDVQSGF